MASAVGQQPQVQQSQQAQQAAASNSWCNCSWSTIASAVAGLAAAAFAYISYTAGSVQAGFAAVIGFAAPITGYASTAVALATANPLVAGAVIVGVLALAWFAHSRGYLTSCSSCSSSAQAAAPQAQPRDLDAETAARAAVQKAGEALAAADAALGALHGADDGAKAAPGYQAKVQAAHVAQARALVAFDDAQIALGKLTAPAV